MLSNVLGESSLTFLDPSDDLLNAHLELVVAGERVGKKPYACPLFNFVIKDLHFSALGSKAWAQTVGRRLTLCSRVIQRHRWRSTDGMISLRRMIRGSL